MAKKSKMTEYELLAEIRSDIDLCVPESSQVSSERAKALKYYLGEPFGNEVEGRSSIVTTDVSDVIEGALPPLLKLFTSSDDVALFDPVGPEDEKSARQESDYINYVFYKDNPGFQILYTWFKDALMSKNGVVKYYWCDESEEVKEQYEGQTQEQVQLLLADDNIEVTEASIEGDPMNPTFSVSVIRNNKKGKLEIVVIPPEKFHIHPQHNTIDLKEVPFCAHETDQYKYELLESGFDPQKVEDLFDEVTMNSEEQARFSDVTDADTMDQVDRVTIYECYKRVDWDGDGYPELRKITIGGESTILENEEVDYIPFVAITPVPMTHRWVGRSYADLAMDSQLYRSTLLRNIFDNLYLINNQRTGVVEGEVNLDDLLDSRPGGVVRMTSPNMVFPIPTGTFPASAYQMMEYLDNMRENRTGITRYNQGMDANALNKTATGVNKIMEASQERLLLVAKLFADGLKDLFLGMHRLIRQHQDVKRVVRLRGEWVDVNPSEWNERMNMTVNVALGTNDKEQQIQMLMLVGQIQKEMMGAGKTNMVDDNKLYNTARKLVEATGFRHVEYFFMDPATQPPVQPPPPPPEAQAAMIMAQAEMKRAEAVGMEAQLKMQKAQWDHEEAMLKLQLEQQKLQLEAMKAGLQGQISMERHSDDLEIKQQKVAIDAVKAGADIKSKAADRAERRENAAYDILKTNGGMNDES